MPTGPAQSPEDGGTLFTRTRRIEAGRIVIVGIITLLYWRGVVPFPVLLIAIAVGLYPLARRSADLRRARNGTHSR